MSLVVRTGYSNQQECKEEDSLGNLSNQIRLRPLDAQQNIFYTIIGNSGMDVSLFYDSLNQDKSISRLFGTVNRLFNATMQLGQESSALTQAGNIDQALVIEDKARKMLEQKSAEFKQNFEMTLVRAKVTSHRELGKKQAAISEMREKGVSLFLANSDNIELMIQADIAAAHAYEGRQEASDRRVISSFWHMIEGSTDRITLYHKANQMLGEIVTDVPTEFIEEMEKDLQTCLKFDTDIEGRVAFTKYRIKKFEAVLDKRIDKLKTQLSSSSDSQEKIFLAYVIRKVDLQCRPIINYCIRQMVEKDALQFEHYVSFMSTNWLKPDLESNLAHAVKSWAREKADYRNYCRELHTDPTSRFNRSMLNISRVKESNTFGKERQTELQDQLTHFDRTVLKIFKSPKKIRDLSPMETEYEKATFGKHSGAFNAEGDETPAEIEKDLSKLSPEYFVQQMVQDAKRQIAIFAVASERIQIID